MVRHKFNKTVATKPQHPNKTRLRIISFMFFLPKSDLYLINFHFAYLRGWNEKSQLQTWCMNNWKVASIKKRNSKLQQFIPLKHKQRRRKYINFIIEFWLLSDRFRWNAKLDVYTWSRANKSRFFIDNNRRALFVNKN